jgi:hypothetical protein
MPTTIKMFSGALLAAPVNWGGFDVVAAGATDEDEAEDLGVVILALPAPLAIVAFWNTLVLYGTVSLASIGKLFFELTVEPGTQVPLLQATFATRLHMCVMSTESSYWQKSRQLADSYTNCNGGPSGLS